jgi:hypothetical protein
VQLRYCTPLCRKDDRHSLHSPTSYMMHAEHDSHEQVESPACQSGQLDVRSRVPGKDDGWSQSSQKLIISGAYAGFTKVNDDNYICRCSECTCLGWGPDSCVTCQLQLDSTTMTQPIIQAQGCTAQQPSCRRRQTLPVYALS